MLREKVTMLIFSCDKFSDLWDAHVKQLEAYWPDREIDTYIVTDAPQERAYERVKILAAGADKEFSERLEFALKQVKTEYVFVTLDDYFLIQTVKNEQIRQLVSMMDQEKLDYVRLFARPKRATGEAVEGYEGMRWIHTENPYSVNLYVGLWRKSFMAQTVRDVRDPWRFEVSLAGIATELKARCVVSDRQEFKILDVVRKGKILNKANRYFKKHDSYRGNREVHTYWYEIKLGIRTWGARHAPRWMVNAARKFMIKRGHRYYSQED